MKILRGHEEWFLLDAGWVREGEDAWFEPQTVELRPGLQPRVLPFGHAVNSEKLHGLERGTHGAKAHDVLVHAEIEYLLRNGWEPADEEVHRRGSWREPEGRHRHRWTRPTHKALSSQKQWDRTTARVEAVIDKAFKIRAGALDKDRR